MSIVLQSTSGGQITIQEPATASNFTQTLPSASGTVMVSGNQPAFSANAATGTAQSLTSGSWTKVQFNVEIFDTNNNYDPTTNYRFTPTVAGYYQVSWGVAAAATTAAGIILGALYKNGSAYCSGTQLLNNTANGSGSTGSVLVYLNGSTDYIEVYAIQTSGGALNIITATQTTQIFFTGCLVRAA